MSITPRDRSPQDDSGQDRRRSDSGREGQGAARLGVTQIMNTVARVVTPWQALSDEQMAQHEGGLHEWLEKTHVAHYSDPRKRARNPFTLEHDSLDGPYGPITMDRVAYGDQAGWFLASGMVFHLDQETEAFDLMVFPGYTARGQFLIGLHWELGPGPGLAFNNADPVGDTFLMDDSLFPEIWHVLIPVVRLFEALPALERLLVPSEGVSSFLEALAGCREKLADDRVELPYGWRQWR